VNLAEPVSAGYGDRGIRMSVVFCAVIAAGAQESVFPGRWPGRTHPGRPFG
jgi:hypothetical protein